MALKGGQQACQRCVKYRNWPKCGQKQVSLCASTYMRTDVIPARGEESCGSRFLHMVPFAEYIPDLNIHKPSGKYCQ